MTLSKRCRKTFSCIGFFVTIAAVLFLASDTAFSQQSNTTLEDRVEALEDYVATIQPTLVELSDNLNNSIQQYTSDLESSLETYSRKLQRGLDQRLDRLGQNTVVLNPFSKAYQTLQTNTGTFLIAVERVEPIERGVRLQEDPVAYEVAFARREVWQRKQLRKRRGDRLRDPPAEPTRA